MASTASGPLAALPATAPAALLPPMAMALKRNGTRVRPAASRTTQALLTHLRASEVCAETASTTRTAGAPSRLLRRQPASTGAPRSTQRCRSCETEARLPPRSTASADVDSHSLRGALSTSVNIRKPAKNAALLENNRGPKPPQALKTGNDPCALPRSSIRPKSTAELLLREVPVAAPAPPAARRPPRSRAPR